MSAKDDGILTPDEVKDVALKAIEDGKQKLLTDGRVYRYAYIFTEPSKVEEGLEGLKELKLDTGVKEPKERVGTSVVLLDLCPDDPDLLDIIVKLHPEQLDTLAMLLTLGKISGKDDRYSATFIAKTWLASRSLAVSDLVGQFFKHMVRKLGAYAYVHVSETYHQHGIVKDEKGKRVRPEQDPHSDEALLVFWETRDGGEIYITPFTRTERDVGKVTGFGEQVTLDMQTTAGQLTGILSTVRDINVAGRKGT